MDALIELCQLLSAGDEALLAEVKQSIEAPEVYVKQHAVRVARRGIQGQPAGLPWIALVDGLSERDLLLAVPWDADQESVRNSIDALRGGRGLGELDWEWLDEDPERYAEADVETLLYTIAEQLAEENQLLVELTYPGDDYQLTVVPDGDIDKLLELSHRAPVGSLRIMAR